MKKYRLSATLTLISALLTASNSWAALVINNTRGLAFGTFAAGNGGTISVDPSGVRNKTGDVTLLSVGSATSAEFMVSDNDPVNAFRSYGISLPANGQVFISNGGTSMAVNDFTSAPAGSGTLSAGSQRLSVGATLSVGASQPPGDYSGNFSVTIIYQ